MRMTLLGLVLVLTACGGGGGGGDDEDRLIATLALPTLEDDVREVLTALPLFLAIVGPDEDAGIIALLPLAEVRSGDFGVGPVREPSDSAAAAAVIEDLGDGQESLFSNRVTTLFYCVESADGCSCAPLFTGDDVTMLVPSATNDLTSFEITGVAFEAADVVLDSPGQDLDGDGQWTDLRVEGRVLIFGRER